MMDDPRLLFFVQAFKNDYNSKEVEIKDYAGRFSSRKINAFFNWPTLKSILISLNHSPIQFQKIPQIKPFH